MKILTLALIGAGGYYLYKKSQQPTVTILPSGTSVAPAPVVATLSTNPAPQILATTPAQGSPIATAVAPATTTFGTLGGTVFSSKRGMGIF